MGQLCQNCLVGVLMNHLGKNFEQCFFFLAFSMMSWNFLDFLRTEFNGFVKTASYVSTGTFWGKNLMLQFFLELAGTSLKFLPKNLRQICQNCIVRAQRSHLKKTSVFRNANSLCFFVFGFLVENFWAVGKKNRHVCQNCILLLNRNILKKKVNMV